MKDCIIRKATAKDIPALIQLRIDFLVDHTPSAMTDEAALREKLAEYYTAHLSDESFAAVLAEQEGQVASVAFLSVAGRPPSPAFPNGRTGTILNVLTYPQYRRQGLGRQVVAGIIEEAKRLGLSRIDLSATEDGEHLYEKLGFRKSHYQAMNLSIIDK